MNKFFKAATQSISSFVKDEEGAQIIEYALIIAVVSLALIAALAGLAQGDFNTWIARVGTCLRTGACALPTPTPAP